MAALKTDPFPFASTPAALASLATSVTVGVQTGERVVDTGRNLDDITANWEITSAAFIGSASTKVDVYVWGTADNAGYPGMSTGTIEIITGVAGPVTISALGLIGLKFLESTPFLQTTAIAGVAKGEASIVERLGFKPRRFGLVFINNTGAALAASGHSIECVEHYYN
jgi:hypothetical protein